MSATTSFLIDHVIGEWQRRVAKRELGLASQRQAVPAAITAIHRVGSALNLNLHLHSVITDGVFAVFRALPAPEKSDRGGYPGVDGG